MPRPQKDSKDLIGYSLDIPREYLQIADKIAERGPVPVKRAQVIREAIRRGLEQLSKS
jgi:hypothetical protein